MPFGDGNLPMFIREPNDGVLLFHITLKGSFCGIKLSLESHVPIGFDR